MIKINKRFFRGKFQGDRAILMVCIGIAFVFWLLTKLSQTYRAQKEIVFEVSTPFQKALSELPPDNVVADVEGTGWDLLLDHFQNRSLRLQYDLESVDRLDLPLGQLRADIKTKLYSGDIKILELNYDYFSFQVEDQVQKKVPLYLQMSLAFAPEHQLSQPVRLQPDSVLLIGPQSVVEQHEFWMTDSLIFKALKRSQIVPLPLQKPSREITLIPLVVNAEIEVEPFTEKSFYVPLRIKNGVDSMRIFPDKVMLTCKLGLSQYDQVSYRDFKAEIDLSEAVPNAGDYTVPISIVDKPDFIQSFYFTPKVAKFFIIEPVDTLGLSGFE